MTSSYKSLNKLIDWRQFSPREIPAHIEILSPSLEMVAVLQAHQSLIAQEQQASEKATNDGLASLAQQAVFVAQFAMNLDHYKVKLEDAGLNKVYRALRIVKDQMMTAFMEAGLEVIVPLGSPFEDVIDEVEVISWHHDKKFSDEVVAEVLEPIVRAHGKLIRSGRVVMGAPIRNDVEIISL